MTLSDLASLSTAVSGVAVPFSLLYLAIQTRQASRHTRALIQQGLTARTIEISLAHQRPESCASWIEGNGGAATPEEIRRLQFGLACATAVASMEDLYLQHVDGLLTPEHFGRNCNVFRRLLSEPGLREHWLTTRDDTGKVAPRFRAFVDSLLVGDAQAYRGQVQ